MRYTSLLLVFFIFYACANDDDESAPRITPDISGMGFSQSENSYEQTYNNIRSTLSAGGISVSAEIDHAVNARAVGMTLPETRLVIFGDPDLDIPLIQQNQLAALDLPQKILVYQEDNVVLATYNTIAYLASRHNLDLEMPELQEINTFLSEIIVNATNVVPSQPDDATVANKEGIITVPSNQPFNATYDALREAISMNEDLRIISEIDHQTNGNSVNKAIRPTRLIIFGNPNLGTPLMQEARSTALDLPQKMLVWRDDTGFVHISYTDPNFLAKRHDIRGSEEIIETMYNALERLSAAAAN